MSSLIEMHDRIAVVFILLTMFRRLRDIWKTEFFRNVTTLISGTTLAQAFSVIVYIFLSRIYSDEDFGVFGLFMNILNITIIFATGKYELSILLPRKDREAVNLLGLSGLISVGVCLVLFLPVLFLREQIGRWLGSELISPWLWFIPLSTLLVGLFQSFRNYSNREKRYRLIAGANITQSLGNSLMKLGLGLVVAGSAGLIFGALLGQLLGVAVFLGLHARLSLDKVKWFSFGEMRKLAREYRLFPRFNMLQGLINNLSGALPVFVFSAWFSTAVAGLYTFGYMVIYRPVNLVANSFHQVMYQRFSEKRHRKEPLLPEIGMFLRQTVLWLLLPFIVMGIFAPSIFGFVFGEEWVEAGRFTQLLLPWFFTVSFIMPLTFIPDLYGRQRTAMFIDGIRLLLRAAALAAGVGAEDVYLGLALFSGASTLMSLVNLVWYIRLVKSNEPEKDG